MHEHLRFYFNKLKKEYLYQTSLENSLTLEVQLTSKLFLLVCDINDLHLGRKFNS